MKWFLVVVGVVLATGAVVGVIFGNKGGAAAGYALGETFGGFFALAGVVVASILSAAGAIPQPGKLVSRVVWIVVIMACLGNCMAIAGFALAEKSADRPGTRAIVSMCESAQVVEQGRRVLVRCTPAAGLAAGLPECRAVARAFHDAEETAAAMFGNVKVPAEVGVTVVDKQGNSICSAVYNPATRMSVPAAASAAPAATTPFAPVSDDELEVKLSLACTDEALCACVRARFDAAAPAAKRKELAGSAIDEIIDNARDDCVLRGGEVRAGVTSTCLDGKTDAKARARCDCAAAAFLEKATTDELRALKREGWTSESTHALDVAKRGCK